MGRPRKIVPSYLKHSQLDRAIVIVRCADDNRKTILLPGPFRSHESLTAYNELLVLLNAHGGRLPDGPRTAFLNELTILELCEKFNDEKVAVDFVRAGQPTSEWWCFRQAMRALCRLYGTMTISQFDSACLKAVQQAMIAGSWMNSDEIDKAKKAGRMIGWSRRTINKQVSRIRSIFRWGVPAKLVPASVVSDLECLPPLRKGKGGAREMPKVKPVPVDVRHLPRR